MFLLSERLVPGARYVFCGSSSHFWFLWKQLSLYSSLRVTLKETFTPQKKLLLSVKAILILEITLPDINVGLGPNTLLRWTSPSWAQITRSAVEFIL